MPAAKLRRHIFTLLSFTILYFSLLYFKCFCVQYCTVSGISDSEIAVYLHFAAANGYSSELSSVSAKISLTSISRNSFLTPSLNGI